MSQTKAQLINAKGDAAFDTNTLYVDAANNRIGVGTSSPNTKAHLYDSSNTALKIESTGANYVETNFINSSAAYTLGIRPDTSNSFCVRDNTASATRIVLDSSGRVGIGVTSPATSLHLLGANTAARGQLSIVGNAADPRLTLYRDSSFIGSVNGDTTNGVAIVAETGYSITFNPGGTSEKGRFDSSGRLLLGTSSNVSGALLQVTGSIGVGTSAAVIRRNEVQGSTGLRLQGNANDTVSDTNPGAYINIGGGPFTDTYEGSINLVAYGSTSAGERNLITFSNRSGTNTITERMRINNAGYAKFGITGSYEGGNIYEFNGGENTGACLVVRWTPSGLNSGNGFVVKTPNTAAATTHNFIAADTSAGNVFKVRADGNVYNTNGVYGSISDLKLKENIVDASSQWSDIKALRVRKYNFKEGLTHTQIGVIAQEVEQVSPGLVYETPDRDVDGNETGEVTKGINYSVLYMKAVKALQEAMERIETLEAKVAALESA